MKTFTYTQLALLGITLWLAETWYFKWNETPQSDAERILDFVSGLMIFWGVLGDLFSNVHFTKTTVLQAALCGACDKRMKE